jgi:hypothetical protein
MPASKSLSVLCVVTVTALLAAIVSMDGAQQRQNAAPQHGIKVDIVGELRGGIVAIGGETTGTQITVEAAKDARPGSEKKGAEKIVWELDLRENEKFENLAENLHRRTVRVYGTLRLVRGIEIQQRWIVGVDRLEEAVESKSAE